MHRTQLLSGALFRALCCSLVLVHVSGATSSTSGRIIGESALVDKESGRIFWESGGSASTLTASVVPKLQEHVRILHYVRPTIMSCILLMAALRFFTSNRGGVDTAEGSFSVLCLLPKFHPWFIAAVAVLYILEAFLCSTRQYLSNPVHDLDDYLDSLKRVHPVVEWKVRSYAFQRRAWTAPIQFLRQLGRNETNTTELEDDSVDVLQNHSPWLYRKKVQVTKGKYHFGSCIDQTVVGTWKRSVLRNGSGNNNNTRNQDGMTNLFSKIRLTKLLVLPSAKARADYFQQQGKFVADAIAATAVSSSNTTSTSSGVLSEFSTNIYIPGYRPKVLAAVGSILRSTTETNSTAPEQQIAFRLSFFWIFTLLGLTVPYRLWFDRRCDEFRVSVIKETFPDTTSSSWFSSWKTSAGSDTTSVTTTKAAAHLQQGVEKEQTILPQASPILSAPQHTPEEEGQFRSFLESLKDKLRVQPKVNLETQEIADIVQSVESADAIARKLDEEKDGDDRAELPPK